MEYLTLKGYSPKTRQSILYDTERFAQWCEGENVDMPGVTYNDMTSYIGYCKEKGNKPKTIKFTVNSIKHYYNFLLSREEVADNPCSNIKIMGVKRRTLHETFTPEELDNIYKGFSASSRPTGIGSRLSHSRSKVILSLIIYQGLKSEELNRLTVADVNIREGKVHIARSRKNNERKMILEAHQLYEMMDYINDTRKVILALTGKTTDALFPSLGEGKHFHNILAPLLRRLRKQFPKVRDINHLRASVITNWLKVHNLRKAQHLAGHRYVSSTELYQVNNMDSLIEDVNNYHPDL